jgi:hypothetical protein
LAIEGAIDEITAELASPMEDARVVEWSRNLSPAFTSLAYPLTRRTARFGYMYALDCT